MSKGSTKALLDTSFLIRLLRQDDPLHNNAKEYMRYLLEEKEATLYVSTIAIAEYCVRGSISDLPLKHLRQQSYTTEHSIETSKIFNALNQHRENFDGNRDAIKDDFKMFAQANVEGFDYFLSSDTRACNLCRNVGRDIIHFEFVDIHTPSSEHYSYLNFEES